MNREAHKVRPSPLEVEPEGRRRTRIARGPLVFLLATAALGHPLSAQTARAWRVEPGVGVSYFPDYVYEDAETQYWGVDFVARGRAPSGTGVEVGYTFVPQAATSAHSAPRLSAFRVMAVQSLPGNAESTLSLVGGVGVAALVLSPQQIDCGEYPICSEWAPRSGTRWAPVIGVGLAVNPFGRVSVHGDARAFRPVGEEWEPLGETGWVTELSAGLRIVLGG